MGWGIGIGIGWPNASAGISYAKKLIKAFKERVLSYPNSIFEAEACLDATLTELSAIGLLKEASLVITPNAYNEGILYDVVPNTTLGDMNVVRATTATRVNELGLIEVVPRNLLTYSEQFNNGIWTKLNTTIIPNSINSPTGTLTANSLVGNTTNARHNILQSLSDTSDGSYSLYVKANQLRYIQFASTNTAGQFANFDILTGTIGTVGGDFSNAKITLITNGWYRISVTSVSRYNNFYISLVSSLTAGWLESWAMPNNTDSLYIWGAQLDQGSLTEYFPTTTRLNIPRIDYSNGSCPSILVEPQRTNLVTYSEQFSDASWTKLNATITANTTTAPNGTLTADTLVCAGTTAGTNYVRQGRTINSNTHTLSFYAKANASSIVRIAEAALTGEQLNYDLSNNTISGSGSQISGTITENVNGWKKITFTYIYTAGQTNCIFNINSTSCFIWGAQLESGSYATSYIPTIASIQTRNADVISKTGISSLINSQEGVIYFEGSALANNTGARVIELKSNANLMDNVYFRYETTNNSVAFTVFSGGVLQCNINYSLPLTQIANNKMAFVWALNRFEIWVNGSKVAEDTLGIPPASSSLNNIIFNDRNSLSYFEGKIKLLGIYKEALSNTELAKLTTL